MVIKFLVLSLAVLAIVLMCVYFESLLPGWSALFAVAAFMVDIVFRSKGGDNNG